MDDDITRAWEAVRTGAEEWPQEWYDANRRAQLALSGMYSDVVGMIVRLLRSDMPLHPVFRGVLADALEGQRPKGAANFKMYGVASHGFYSPKARETFSRQVEIGEFIVSQIDDSGATRTEAEEAAVIKFGVGAATANKITDGYRKMMDWVDDLEVRRGDHYLAMAQVFDGYGDAEMAEQLRARAKTEKEAPRMTLYQRRIFCLNTYCEPLVKAKGAKPKSAKAGPT